ncbi:tRNA methyltransferase 10 homolog A-like [Sitophilus oryzae]|uniref:tRNA (guanine(9)-N(1))-methyltransferase n=1 Tax=Sitophilus oryzae TaxID=7048 RepID=A0A6J2YG67_SITOR|nr:tRNA methyltransferase 10 homolog A-like [Sitophilus oryzae]
MSENTENIANTHSESGEIAPAQTEAKEVELTNLPHVELFNGIEISKLTKRQTKKYKKYLKWEENKKERRAKQKEKLKAKKEYARLHNIKITDNKPLLLKNTMDKSPCKISICIDLSWSDLMTDKDMNKAIKQVIRIYAENRRAKAPMQLHLTTFVGKNKEVIRKHGGSEKWDVNFHESHYMDIFPKDRLIYLTSDSTNVIQKLEDDKVYIIGGLVDHNAHKGICYKKAVEEGISHGQLPIGEYFKLKQRKVLTINQVFEILLRVSEGKSFKEAIEINLPKRKDVLLINKTEKASQEPIST